MDNATLLHELLDEAEAAAADPAAPAITARGRGLCWPELAALAARFGAALHARGLRRGDRLVLVNRDDVRLAALMFAASRIGAVFTVLHQQVRGDALRHVLRDCTPGLLVGEEESMRRTAEELSVPAVGLDELEAELPAAAPPDEVPGPLPVDPICLIYTSGTTALPKAVVSTHQQVLFATRAIQDRLRYRADDLVYSPLPISFDYGLYQIFLAAVAGAHLRLAAPATAGPRWLLGLVRSRATVLPSIPPVAAALLDLLRRDPAHRPPLRLLTNTGAAVHREVLAGLRERLPELRVQLMFGLTECKRVSIMEPDEDLERPDSVGRPLRGTEVFTVDEAGGRLPTGEIGELAVRGPNVMAGYWRRPELDQRRFPRRDGLFPELRTGDRGWVDEDGHLHFLGRSDDVYKQQGFRVSSVEVEAAARKVPGVEAAAVLPDRDDGAVLYVVGEVDSERVGEALREHLEDFKIPAECRALAELPVNANGKIDKKALAASLEQAAEVSRG